MPAKDIRLEVRARNNLILRKMEEREPKIGSIAELCRLLGKPKAMTRVGQLVNMKEPARNKDGSWCQMALDLAEFFWCLPEDLFSDVQQNQRLEKNRMYAEVAFSEIQQMLARPETPELAVESVQLRSAVTAALGTLSHREERVLRMRFGIGIDQGMSFEEVARVLQVTDRRVLQIEAKALRKLKHPSRARGLRAFKPGAEWNEKDQEFV